MRSQIRQWFLVATGVTCPVLTSSWPGLTSCALNQQQRAFEFGATGSFGNRARNIHERGPEPLFKVLRTSGLADDSRRLEVHYGQAGTLRTMRMVYES